MDRYGNQRGGYSPPGYRPSAPRGGSPRGGVTPEGYRPPTRPQRVPGGGQQRGARRPEGAGQDGGRGQRARRPQARKRRRPRRIVGIALLVILALIVGAGVYVDVSLNREDALADYPGRPAAAEGTNWLIVGSDSRNGLSAEDAEKLHTGTESDAGGKRTDSMMLLHIPSSGAKPTMVSLLRDSYVDIPGHDSGKINSAYAFGGPQLLARTVEENTGLHLDHYMEIGFGGFAGIVDDVGGVNMCLKEPVEDDKAGIDLPAGCQDLAGPDALGYVRSRYAFDGGDYERTDHQREFLGALAGKMSGPSVLLNPIRLVPLIWDLPGALTVDSGDHVWNLLSVAWNMRGISDGGVNTTGVPIGGDGPNSSLLWDDDKAGELFDALRTDKQVPTSLLGDGS